MLSRTRRLISRIMLIMMLATFVSPTLGWGMVATHDQLSHHAADKHAHAHDWQDDHHHHDGHDDNAQHQDPHNSIGHLLTHMPVSLFSVMPLIIQPAAQTQIVFVRQTVRTVALEPPFRPPQASLSC